MKDIGGRTLRGNPASQTDTGSCLLSPLPWQLKARWTDRRTDRRMDGQKEGWADRRKTDGQKDGRTNGDGQTEIDGWR